MISFLPSYDISSEADGSQETHEPSGSRGTAHFVWRCKNCKREHSASIKDAAKPYLQASPPSRQALIELDCRGLEFLEFRAEVSPRCFP